MKVNAFALLLIFLSFVTLPSIISNVCKDVDISSVFNFSEEKEENHKSGVEKNTEFSSSFYDLGFINQQEVLLTYEILHKHINTSLEIFLPPPEHHIA